MPRIHVCPLSRVAETVDGAAIGHVISLHSAHTPTPPPWPGIEPLQHLILQMSDIDTARNGHVLADGAHLDRLLQFVLDWDGKAGLLMHCYAGVSRSPAAAFVALCALAPAQDEAELAASIRRLSPTATPNRRLVALGDDVLGRSGRMIRAVEAIGRGADCFEGVPFAMDARAPGWDRSLPPNPG